MTIRSRKRSHVELALTGDVSFKTKTTGLERYTFEYNALPELDLADVDTSVTFVGRPLRFPLVITGMTGGYPEAERINTELAQACSMLGIAMGVGSMRAALEEPSLESSFSCVRAFADSVPIIANIGAVQAVRWNRAGELDRMVKRAVELTAASALAVHINPLQELAQPEGEPEFRGVLQTIEYLIRSSEVPLIVKEVGAGLSQGVVDRLRSVGVEIVDVAGAGGTSWAGVEILRHDAPSRVEHLWDVGIPTAECIIQNRDRVPTLIASGGIASGTDIALCIGLGADIVGAARPILQAHHHGGVEEIVKLVSSWETTVRQWMFLTGSATVAALRSAPVIHVSS